MSTDVQPFGRLPDGAPVNLYTLCNNAGAVARITDYGARLVSLHVPDRRGQLANVVLGFDTLEDYLHDDASLGATVGRVAGRISGGAFTLQGRRYHPGCNSENYCLHGGARGFSQQRWTATSEAQREPALTLRLCEPGDLNGFPGDVNCQVRYTLTEQHILRIDYEATSTVDTPFNLTHHSYFNLAGEGSVLDHELQLACAERVRSSEDGRPERTPVAAGFDDYRAALRLNSLAQLDAGNADFYGYLAGGRQREPRFAARLQEPLSGRVLEVYTTEPGIVFYAGLGLGAPFGRCAGLCLEAQDYADSVNEPQLGTALLRAGARFCSRTEYRFSSARLRR